MIVGRENRFSQLCARTRAGATAQTQPFRHFGGSYRSRADAVTGDKSMVLDIFPPDLRGVTPHGRCADLDLPI
jgi:hypothetical protein